MFKLLASVTLIAAIAAPAVLSATTSQPTATVTPSSQQSVIQLEQQLISVLTQLVQLLTSQLQPAPNSTSSGNAHQQKQSPCSVAYNPRNPFSFIGNQNNCSTTPTPSATTTTSTAPTVSAPTSSGSEAVAGSGTTTSQVECAAGYHECTGAACLHLGIALTVPYYCITSSSPIAVTPLPAGAVWPSGECLNAMDLEPTVIQASVDYFGNPLPGECVPDDPTSAL